ncbi:amino acid adenylation domain-containing protein [Brevibacillus antibioticus]|uniref:Amino acid adenylation domain-containing protein n=1 Tax=Brevibacillus antibioticus TaxID=2570228 RepID=A0A4U2Y6Q5_9BACL|nr:non-ribosomal peptide synthetase [Brevibacillus antibioticus]TKI55482.1 amino acid adenylation domain-containing protein [Brevibacillus antibioticus]
MKTFSKDHVQDIYSLSPMQEGMLFHALADTEDTSYQVQIVLPVAGDLDVTVLAKSFELLVQRHDVLRTTFLHEQVKHPMQVVLRERPLMIQVQKPPVESVDFPVKEWAEQLIRKDRERGFDLTKDPLIRLMIIEKGAKEWTLLISFHHILMDGWCADIILDDLVKIYHSLLTRTPDHLPPTQPYSHYMKWLWKQDRDSSLEYWQNELRGYEEIATLPVGSKLRDVSSASGEYDVFLDLAVTQRLTHIARQNQVTLSSVFQAIWGVVLQTYNDRTDVVFGTVVAGRPAELSGVERMVGLFINTLPLRVKRAQELIFQELLQNIHEQTRLAKKHEYVPLSEIQRVTLRAPLFDHLLVFDNSPANQTWRRQWQEDGVHPGEKRVIEHTHYPLSITVMPKADQLMLRLIYRQEHFSSEDIQRIAGHIQTVAELVSLNVSISLDEIEMLTAEEKHHFLAEKNRTNTNYPRHQTVADLFEQQVKEVPKQAALVYGQETLTYEELNQRANRIAHQLQQKGVQPDELIGLFTERSPTMIAGIFGILKAGVAYVPLDPRTPPERLGMILSDAKPKMVLIQREMLEKWREVEGGIEHEEIFQVLVLEDLLAATNPEWNHNPLRTCQPDHLAYVMYTSGSTGKPKGILTQHFNVTRVIKTTNYIEITSDDTILQLSNFAFDGSTFDIFGALLNGAKLVLLDHETLLNMTGLLSQIKEQGVTIFFVTTALFNTLVDHNIESFSGVRKVLFGGERVSLRHVQKALAYMGKGALLHVYGPTESTVYATYHAVDEIDEALGTVPIGVPLANTQVFILNKKNHLQPYGAIGELCISGDGLARGYLNNPELTVEKFVPHPFYPGERMYKTGDLARWLPDGTIEFIGRVDHQVKRRGFRIELGEIEHSLLQQEGIKEAVVIDWKSTTGLDQLCAYFVANHAVDVQELRDQLAKSLPFYMLPSTFHQMASLPLNINGKVDRRALPEPDWEALQNQAYMAPRNETEQQLVQIWQKVLGISRVGLMDNYYQLGGDSIKAIQICARLREQDVMIQVKDLFNQPTIAGLSSFLQGNQAHAAEHSANVDSVDTTPVLLDELGLSLDEMKELEEELKVTIQ